MAFGALRALVCAAAGVAALAAISGDEVTQLPGWMGPLPSRQFSGLMP